MRCCLTNSLKEHQKVEQLGRELGEQQNVNAELRSTIAQQEKQMTGLAQQIEKISGQIREARVGAQPPDK